MMSEIQSENSVLHKMIADLRAELIKERGGRHDEFIAYKKYMAGQAEVIKAQRVNLEAARIVIKQAHSAAEDAQGQWLPIAKPYLPMDIFMFRQISEILSTALEGVELEEKLMAE